MQNECYMALPWQLKSRTAFESIRLILHWHLFRIAILVNVFAVYHKVLVHASLEPHCSRHCLQRHAINASTSTEMTDVKKRKTAVLLSYNCGEHQTL